MSTATKEIDKFNALAHTWWDTSGEFKTLHQINPLRLKFVTSHADIENKALVDVGCGGGIFAESLAQKGAKVSAIDMADKLIEIAKLHLLESGLSIDYKAIDTASYANNHSEHFDILTCMEMLEHVEDVEAIISSCAKMLKTGGIAFFSTLNRNVKSYLLAVIAAEYILRILPKGTHEYKKFIRPDELRTLLAKNGLHIYAISGISYNPLLETAKLNSDVDVNYIVACRKE